MTPKEITALALEYAEEEYKTLNLPTDHTEVSAYRYMDFARFLLRRFYLVEKEAVRKEFHEIELALGDGGRSEWEDDINMEKEALLKSLFPDLGKEVEG